MRHSKRTLLTIGRRYLTLAACTLMAGCGGDIFRREASQQAIQGFEVSKIRIQPAFTKIVSPLSPAESGVIETFIELSDQFGDPIKATGTFRFELYQFRTLSADPRGQRYEPDGLQTVDLRDLSENQKHWDPISRSYQFKIKLPKLPANTDKVVLQATLALRPEFRLQDMLIITRKP